jgi:WD40 repeat protein
LRALLITLSAAAVAAGAGMFFLARKTRPVERRVSNVALSRSGRWIAAGTSQGRISVWDGWADASPRRVEFSHGPLNDLQFSPDEQTLAAAGMDLGLYSREHPAATRWLRSDHRNYGTVRFSRDGQAVLVITGLGTIEVLDAASGAVRLSICCSTVYGEVAFTPDEQNIVNAGHQPRFWDPRSGELVAPLTKDREVETFGPVAFDRGTILMGSQDGRVYQWDLATRQPIAMSPAHAEYVNTIAVLSTGLVAHAGFGKSVWLWNPQTGEERAVAGAAPTSNLIAGADGGSLLFGTADGQIEVWDAHEGRRLRAMHVP